MPSTFRIPKADLTGLYGVVVRRVSKKMYGEVPDVCEIPLAPPVGSRA